MARENEDKELSKKPPKIEYRKSIQIAPALRKRLSFTFSFGGREPQGQFVLSSTEGCACPPPETDPGYETHDLGTTTEDPYPRTCTDARLEITLLDVELKDEGLNVLDWMYEVQTHVLPNGMPPMLPIPPTPVTFTPANPRIPQNLAAFQGVGGYCGLICPEGITNQIVTTWGKTKEGDDVAGSTAAFESVSSDHVYRVEALVIHPKSPMRRARLWFRFLVSKTC